MRAIIFVLALSFSISSIAQETIVQTPQGRYVQQGGTALPPIGDPNASRIVQTPQGRFIQPEGALVPQTPVYPQQQQQQQPQTIYIGPRQDQPQPYAINPGAPYPAFAPQSAGGLQLVPGAPDQYTVAPGDTLWTIASRYLRSPHRWPELWRMNAEEIRNPQRIYPGMMLVLDRNAAGGPQLRVAQHNRGTGVADKRATQYASFSNRLEPRVYVDSSLQNEIPSIPQSVIEPFLNKPFLVDPNRIKGLPHIVAFQGDHISVGPGDLVYAKGINPEIKDWQIVRPDKLLPDPDKPGRSLGLVVNYIGPAELVRPGNPSTLRIGATREETVKNDLLVPAARRELIAYVPRAPAVPINARIINLLGGVGEGGQFSVVSISRGGLDGIERGHVLSIYRKGETQVNRSEEGKRRETVFLPEEEYGTLFVFRVFEHAAYALVMHASRSVYPGDLVRNP